MSDSEVNWHSIRLLQKWIPRNVSEDIYYSTFDFVRFIFVNVNSNLLTFPLTGMVNILF